MAKRKRNERKHEQSAIAPAARRPWVFPLVLAGATFVAYAASFSGVFLFDETKDILNSERIRSIFPLGETLAGRRPVIDLTLAVNYAISELKPWSYHVFNLMVHILAGFTLFGIIRRAFSSPRLIERYKTSGPMLAFVIALIWLVHPLQTQAVTYVIQRSESLMGLFYLLTLYCTIRGAETEKPIKWFATAVACCALGMGCKAVMITAPALVFLYDWIFLSGSLGKCLRKRWLLYVALCATWGVLIACGVAKGVIKPDPWQSATVGFGFKGITPMDYLLTQPGVLRHYVHLALVPVGQCLDYGWPVAKGVEELIFPGIMVAAALLYIPLFFWRLRLPAFGFLLTAFFIILSPTSSFVPVKDPMFEHRMYLPLVTIIAVMVIWIHQLLDMYKKRATTSSVMPGLLKVGLPVVVVVALMATTAYRNTVYGSAVRMWEDVVTKRPQNARAWHNFGTALSNEEQFDKSAEAYRSALRVDDQRVDTWANLANVLIKAKSFDYAAKAIAQGMELAPEDGRFHDQRGLSYALQGQSDLALESFQRAVRLNPYDAEFHYNFGKQLTDSGRVEEGILHYGEAIRLKPDYGLAYLMMGGALVTHGDYVQAEARCIKGVEYLPDHATGRLNYGAALMAQKKYTQAVVQFNRAINLDQFLVGAHFNLGQIKMILNQKQEAIKSFSMVLRIIPGHPGATQMLQRLGVSARP